MDLKQRDYLPISEDFYSIQGEGISTGVPAYFVRLQECNLNCGASKLFMKNLKKNSDDYDSGDFKGDLHEDGKATWTCDTIPVWIKGHKKPFQYLIDRWKEQNIYEWILSGRVHVIFTGGEPLLKRSQECLNSFMEWWAKEANIDGQVFNPFIEIETNGTQPLTNEFAQWVNQVNCSPKLQNSGHDKETRIVPDAIESIRDVNQFTTQPVNVQWKFVVSNNDDLDEIITDFIKPFNLDPKNIVLMPGLDDQKDFHERTKWVMEQAKEHGFIGLTRLHVSAWNKTTGV